MSRLGDYEVMNFQGGVRRDKSLYALQKDELSDARNVEFDNQGRIKVRRGSMQLGNTKSGSFENSFVFYRQIGSNLPMASFIVNTGATTAVFYRINMIRLTADAAAGATSLSVTDATAFANSGADAASINGDQITYTGKTGQTTLTGVGGVARAYSAGACIAQMETLSPATAMNGALGIYYAVLNNILYISDGTGTWNQIANDDGETMTSVSEITSTGIALTNYRDRLYAVGGQVTPIRVYFSALGNGGSWSTNDYFDVEDQRGEVITGMKVSNDTLWIYKLNSMFSYDQVELKQRQRSVGAYNHKVIQEINGIMYTCCPSGIFATSGSESVDIGEPVREYWENFTPVFDAGPLGRVVTNVFSGRTKDKYILYIQNITTPTTTNDVVLVYDTKARQNKNAWTVWDGGFTNFQHFNYFEKYPYGDTRLNLVPTLFAGDSGGKFYKLHSNFYRDNAATPTIHGGDIITDFSADSLTPVSATFETGLYDLTRPDLYKTFHKLRVFVERGQWNFEYRVLNEQGLTDYKHLGTADEKNELLTFPAEAKGWRIGFRISTTATVNTPILNGFVFKNTQADSRP